MTAPAPVFGSDQLSGFRIGVTSERRAADLIDALVRRGASVMHAPTLRIENDRNDEQVIDASLGIIAASPTVLLATTAYGIRRWFEVADAAGLGDELADTLAEADILVRGPKARGGIRAAGLDDVGMSEEETTASLVRTVLARYGSPQTIALQAHGYLDHALVAELRAAGHTVHVVAPYRWRALDESDDRVRRLVDATCGGALDCITFTSAPAVDALFAKAEAMGRHGELVDALASRVVAASVGPVTSAPLREVGIEPIQPDRFRMGALIRLVCEQLPLRGSQSLATRHGSLDLRGSVLVIDGRPISLTPLALAVFRELFLARGAVVSRERLLQAVPAMADAHALEMAVSRLRRSIGATGLITTVIKRGYRLDL